VGLAKASHKEEEVKLDRKYNGELIDEDGNVVS